MPQLPIGDIGPCEVTWDYGGATPVIITPHLGKVTVRMADAVTDVFIDGQGIAPIEAFFEGSTVELEVPMARSTLSQLANTIGYRDLGTLAGNVLTLHNVAGIEMMAHAKQIVIKPMMNVGGCSVAPNPDPHSWTLFYKCHPWRDFELGFDRGGQRVHMVKFKIFPNQDTGYEGNYFQEGLITWREEFEDLFCTSPLGAEWTIDSLDADKTITVNASPTCTVTIAAANAVDARWFCSVNVAPKMYMPLNVLGPCRITTVLSSLPPDPGATTPEDTMAGMFIGTDPLGTDPGSPPYTAYLWGRYNTAGGDDMRVRDNCGSYNAMTDCSSGCLPKYLKIEIDAAQVITFWFKDLLADPWTQYIHGGNPFEVSGYDIANSYVGLFAKNEVSGVNYAATFDFFKIEKYA